MFYTKTIHIIEETDGHMDDEWGVWVDGELAIVKSVECDVQPITQKQAMEDFGYTKQVKYRIYADLDPLFEIGTIIQYKNQYLKIVEMKEWDDYVDMLVATNEQVGE